MKARFIYEAFEERDKEDKRRDLLFPGLRELLEDTEEFTRFLFTGQYKEVSISIELYDHVQENFEYYFNKIKESIDFPVIYEDDTVIITKYGREGKKDNMRSKPGSISILENKKNGHKEIFTTIANHGVQFWLSDSKDILLITYAPAGSPDNADEHCEIYDYNKGRLKFKELTSSSKKWKEEIKWK